MPLSRSPLPLLAALCALLGAVHQASPQLLPAGRALEVLTTASFSIYFPPELEAEGRRLASFAEEVLAAETGRVGEKLAKRLPVLLTDSAAETNGFFSDSPSNRVVLFVAPFRLDEAGASMADPLRSIFAHELAHVLSLSVRPPLLAFASALFGDQVNPTLYTAPSIVAEGIAIAAEGSDRGGGRGRAWDPLAAAPVREALAEGGRPGFWEGADAGGIYPFGAAPYSYGGSFIPWLEEKAGRGSLARLATELGAFRFPEDGLFARGAFSRTFGEDLPILWKEWRATMAIGRPLVTATRPLVEAPGYISALTAGRVGGRATTIWCDASEGAVLALAEGEEKPRRLFDADGHVNRLALSEDGAFLLLSTAARREGFFRLVVKVWDLGKGGFTGRELLDLREATWVGAAGPSGEGPLLGIAPRGVETDLVRVEGGSGRPETRAVILAGRPTRAFGAPTLLGGATVFVLADEGGQSFLLRLDGSGTGVEAFRPALKLPHLRYLSGRGDELLLGFASDEGLYRLARVVGATDPGPSSLEVQDPELLGGVRMASLRSAPGEAPRVSYLAAFSAGERPMDYPFDNPALALRRVEASWVRLDPTFLETGARAAETGEGPRPASPFPLALAASRIPVISADLDAAGLSLSGTDLTERLSWSLETEYSWGARAANLAGSLGLSLAPWKLDLGALDRFVPLGAGYYRRTRAELGISLGLPSYPAWKRLDLSLDLAAGALVEASALAAASSPYAAPWSPPRLGARAEALWSGSHESYFPPFARRGGGASLALSGEWRPETSGLPSLALEASLIAYAPPLGSHLRLEGAAAASEALRLGPGGRVFSDGSGSVLPDNYTYWDEYARTSLAGSWWQFLEAGLTLGDLEIQERLSLLGLYARRLFVEGGVREGLIGDFRASTPLLLSSAYLRATFEFAPLLGAYAQVGFALGLEAEYAGNPELLASPWRLGLVLEAGH